MYNDQNPNNPYQQSQSNPNQPPYQPPFNPNTPNQPMFAPPPVPPKKHTKRNVGCLVLVVALAICGIVTIANSANSGAKNASTQTTASVATTPATTTSKNANVKPAPTAKPKPTFATFGDGTFQVGKDIQPGTYRMRQGADNCYYVRLKGFTGALDDIIANENTSNPAIVTIDATDKGFQSTGCGTWTKDLSQITTSKTAFSDGMYIVGTDMEPGTYKSSGQPNCYYARLSGFGNTNDDILANDNTDSAAIVTIAAGDKGFQSTSCGTWTKM